MNILYASINSKTLFIKFEESIEIFFPIFQFGCFAASYGLTFVCFFVGKFKKGPPEAVMIISSTSLFLRFLVKFQIEKCSESIGINFVLNFFNFLSINHQPQIIDSLFAIPTVLLNSIASSVGLSPYKPDI